MPKAESIDDLLSVCEPHVRRLAEGARKRILEVVPNATEKPRPGWGLIGYNAPAYFAFIVAAPDRVRIGFEWGVMLPDPAGRQGSRAGSDRPTRMCSPCQATCTPSGRRGSSCERSPMTTSTVLLHFMRSLA
jgi:hypothetical protein